MHLVGFITKIYHDARSPEHHIPKPKLRFQKVSDFDVCYYDFIIQF